MPVGIPCPATYPKNKIKDQGSIVYLWEKKEVEGMGQNAQNLESKVDGLGAPGS